MFKTLLRNEKGISAMGVFSIIIAIIILVSMSIAVYYQYFHEETFSEDEIEKAKKVAQTELGLALQLSESYTFENRLEAIQSIGYGEPTIDDSDYIFEKKDSNSEYYILLRLKPHETYNNVSRVLVSIFDKKNGSLITEMSNVIKWSK